MVAFILLSKILLLQTHTVISPLPNNHVYYTHSATPTDMNIKIKICVYCFGRKPPV